MHAVYINYMGSITNGNARIAHKKYNWKERGSKTAVWNVK